MFQAISIITVKMNKYILTIFARVVDQTTSTIHVWVLEDLI